jgi:hypothetical protein
VQTLAWDLTLHRVLIASIAVLGTIINLTAVGVIICRKFYRQKCFIFVLNFFVGNLLMGLLALPLQCWLSFTPPQKTSYTCVISGYTFFSLTANMLINLMLISLNRYIQIVQFNYYQKIFSKQNTVVMLLFAWFCYPTVLVFPVTGIAGEFTLNPRRLLCTPFISNDGFRVFSTTLAISITAPISVCYIGIIRKAISSRKQVNTSHCENTERSKNEKQLIRSVLVLITVSSIMHMPIMILTEVDPEMKLISPWIHCLFYYLGISMCMMNGLTEFMLNQQIKASFLSAVKQVLKRNRTVITSLGTENYEVDTNL